MISRFFIDRPIFAAVLSIFIVIAGLASMRVLPIAQYPEIAPPVVTVRAVYPGASATVLEQTSAGTRDQTACLTALARQLCSDSSGKRDPSMPRVGKWSATVSNAVVR